MKKKRASKRPRLAHPADIAIGQRIRDLRNAQDPRLPQSWVAREAGCTTQQLQKYESAENRVSVSRLFEIAKALGVKVSEIVLPLDRL